MSCVTSVAFSETVKQQAVACVTEAYLDEIETYIAKHDDEGIMQLDAMGKCLVLKKGMNVSVISLGWDTAIIRYKGKKMYTATAAFSNPGG